MSYHFTHCALRLGDNLAHLHFLRKMAQAYPKERFVHFAHERYLSQLEAMVADLPQIALVPLKSAYFGGVEMPWHMQVPPPCFDSVNAWKNAGNFWETHPDKMHYANFMLQWYSHLAREMGFEDSPESLREPHHLLFDYPAVMKESSASSQCDLLIVNSPPQSGQVDFFDPKEMERFVIDLARVGRRVFITHPLSFEPPAIIAERIFLLSCSVTAIGRASNTVKTIAGIMTGPMWPCFNAFNQAKSVVRIVLCREEIGFGRGMTLKSVAGLREAFNLPAAMEMAR